MWARGRGGSASEKSGGGGGKHGCMACARSVWGSAAGHVGDAAGLGAVGNERRRTRKSNWNKRMRSMRRGGDVDHGGKDASTVSHEPAQKESTPNKETSLAAWLVSARPRRPQISPT